MSLIATLIPVSLVVASVIDKEFFDRWIIAGRVSIKTSYESKEEIVRDLKVKKLDFRIQQNAIRVNYSKDRFCYFINENNKWLFCYSRFDEVNSIISLCGGLTGISVENFERKNSSKIEEKTSQRSVSMPPLPDNRVEVIPTRYTDMNILESVLIEMGLCPIKSGERIKVSKENLEYSFYYDNNQVFLRINGKYDKTQLFEELQDLDAFYGRNVQKKSYDYITDKVADMGMSINEEKILDDNTIVLTINME